MDNSYFLGLWRGKSERCVICLPLILHKLDFTSKSSIFHFKALYPFFFFLVAIDSRPLILHLLVSNLNITIPKKKNLNITNIF